jgi:hypothetical protein
LCKMKRVRRRSWCVLLKTRFRHILRDRTRKSGAAICCGSGHCVRGRGLWTKTERDCSPASQGTGQQGNKRGLPQALTTQGLFARWLVGSTCGWGAAVGVSVPQDPALWVPPGAVIACRGSLRHAAQTPSGLPGFLRCWFLIFVTQGSGGLKEESPLVFLILICWILTFRVDCRSKWDGAKYGDVGPRSPFSSKTENDGWAEL